MSSAFTQFFNTMGRTVVGSQLEADNASYRELWKGVRMNRWKQLTLGRRLVDDELKSVGTLRLKFRMNKEQGVFCDQGPGCLHSEWSHPIYCVCIHGASGCVWGGGGAGDWGRLERGQSPSNQVSCSVLSSSRLLHVNLMYYQFSKDMGNLIP